ncbi:MAG: bile acid:sodium symporter family protein [Tannerella sp.]|jgi:predicted Na+-dependent transporter|nr:bile acid:sodium symporter family protein [Tannerella sp.]
MDFYRLCNTTNKALEKLMPILTPAALAAGFFFSKVFIVFAPFVVEFFALLTLSGALRLTVGDMARCLRHPFPILLFLLVCHVLIPLLAFGASRLLFAANAAVIAGYVLLYATPTAVSTTIWAQIYKGDMALTLTIILLDVLLAPIVTPATVALLVGAKVHLDMSHMAWELVLMVVIPTLVGIFLNESSHGKIPDKIAPPLAPLAKLSIFFLIAGNTAVAAPSIHLSDPLTLLVGILCLVLGIAAYLVAAPVARLAKLPSDKTVSLVMACGMRNISAGATIAIRFFPTQSALPCLLGIVFQQMLAAIVGKAVLKSRKPKIQN